MTVSSDREQIAQTLIDGFHVLQAFTASEPVLTLGQVADRAGLDAGTTFRLVQALVILGYLKRIPETKLFRLTLKPLELGFHAIVQNVESFSFLSGIDNGLRTIPNTCSQSEQSGKPK
jgi:IclR family transcriptional regulator, pca regulon regulatory protein